MLGVKVFAGEKVSGGEIIVRQRGTRSSPTSQPFSRSSAAAASRSATR
jgi:hypothetical protein